MNTWDLLLRRQMLDKITPQNPTKPGVINQQAENFSSPLVQALKSMGRNPNTTKGAQGLLNGMPHKNKGLL